MSRYLLDSDVVIWLLRGREETRALLDDINVAGVPCCSALTVAEVVVGERPKEKKATRELLDSLKVVPLGYEESVLAGELIKSHRSKGNTLSFVDAGIAATCLHNDLVLVTYNSKHYQMRNLKMLPAG